MRRRPAARFTLHLAIASVAACASAPSWAAAQERVAQIRPVTGLTLVSTFRHPEGERDDVVELERVDSAGIHYVWRLVEIWTNGDTVVDARERRVRASDLLGAPRLDPVFAAGDALERPGYTAFSISSAAYVALRDTGRMRFTMTRVDTTSSLIGALAGRGAARRSRYKGTLTRVSPQPAPFPLLVDGRRVSVPALHLRGTFTDGPRSVVTELWVLADSAHPLLLKAATGADVFQMVRVDSPVAAAGPSQPGDRPGGALEQQLATVCRVELPGIYFAFNRALIDPGSDRALSQLGAMLARHPDWSLVVEGHTDSIGTAAANQVLSERRAEAVRTRLGAKHGVDTRTWKSVGYGASKPRESNATIEGRARNRRVELVRNCPERS
jgi:outer membrane protein OmpA-like peptidoglycan-associated protein